MMRRVLPLLLAGFLACSHAPSPFDEEEHESFDKPDAAAAFDAMKRGVDATTDTHRLYAAARAAASAMSHYSTAADQAGGRVARTDSVATRTVAPWTPLGPGNIGGRTRALLFDPVEPRVMYAAGVSGGIWKTTDSGAHWTAIGDLLANLAVNSLVIDPRDRFTLYAGTGEGYYREDVRGTALPLRGDGIFVTHDGGANWRQLAPTAGNPDFQWVNDLSFGAHDSRHLYAATRSGVWRSLDAGSTWKNVLPVTVKGGCTDLALRGDTGGDYLFAACGVFEQATVYRTLHAETDDAWTAVLSDPGMSRTTLAIAPSNPSIVYALAASNNPGQAGKTQNLQAVYRSDQNGDAGSWQVRVRFDDPDRINQLLLTNVASAVCSGNANYAVPMGWHCNVIAVDPTNPDRVWAGGVDLFRSDDGGRRWGLASYWWQSEAADYFVHADQHVIAFDPGYDGAGNQSIWVANDGGVYRTDNANAAVGYGIAAACRPQTLIKWRPLNHNYGVTQFYHGAVFPDGLRFAGGAQDNGSLFGTTSGGIDGWSRSYGGDGGYVVIDQSDPRYVYAESQNGGLVRSISGGNSFISSTGLPGSEDESKFLFVTPMALDPIQTARLWVGGAQMWVSNDRAVTFQQASTTMPAMVSALAIAPGQSNRIVAGTKDGQIVRTDTATTATATTVWSSVQPRSGYVSSITFDPVNANLVWATYAGFGGAHVWRSIDGGATWASSDGSGTGALPDLPVHSLAIDPTAAHRIFLGTDLGVFVSLDDGAHWLVEDSGFSSAVTDWVTIGRGANGPAIYAFTHGRGAWRAELTAPPVRRRATR